MATAELASRELYPQLRTGDRVEVQHSIKVGMKVWTSTTIGTVVKTERRRHGLHYRRNVDDKVFSDVLILKSDDESLTTVTMDEFTVLKKLS
jgi:hypothetical protein